jgi:hypothetical protein
VLNFIPSLAFYINIIIDSLQPVRRLSSSAIFAAERIGLAQHLLQLVTTSQQPE